MSTSKESWKLMALPTVRESSGVHGAAAARFSAAYSAGSG